MHIKTTYSVGDVVRFKRTVKQVDGKTREPETHVGIIEKVIITAKGHYYTLLSSYSGPVTDDMIEAKLVPES